MAEKVSLYKSGHSPGEDLTFIWRTKYLFSLHPVFFKMFDRVTSGQDMLILFLLVANVATGQQTGLLPASDSNSTTTTASPLPATNSNNYAANVAMLTAKNSHQYSNKFTGKCPLSLSSGSWPQSGHKSYD